LSAVTYQAPVRQGDIVEIAAVISSSGRTSLTVDVEMLGEELLSGTRRACGTGRFVFVALDEHGQPVAIHEIPPFPANGGA
jgi:acyl-CoA hydrolase